MSAGGLISVAEALSRVLAAAPRPLAAEAVAIEAALGRTLAEDVHALRTQPPFANSAMDGYALRAADTSPAPARLRVIGESAAGRPFVGRVQSGEAVRIFTGAPMPDGRMQEPGGWNRFSVEVPDLAAAVEELRSSGARFRNDVVTGVGGRQIIIEDPSGNPVELFEPILPEAKLSRPAPSSGQGVDPGT